jgi:translation initiation factor 1
MKDSELVWSSESGDMRGKSNKSQSDTEVIESELVLKLRRLTSGKGRTVIEMTGLPQNKKWNQRLCKEIKKSLGVGGAFKSDFIEIHSSEFEKVVNILDKRSLRWKKTGG